MQPSKAHEYNNQLVVISASQQQLYAYENDKLCFYFTISTGKNGLGERKNSECTPRGWHRVASIIGRETEENAVFVGRRWTGELYSEELKKEHPDRDWILTRIIQLDGLELGRNKGLEIDSLARFIYLHGTPNTTQLGIPGSRGCVRINNKEIILLADWIKQDTLVFIQ